MLSGHKTYHCQHRSDDFPSIAAILAVHQPLIAVELGTDEGGFSGWLADLIAPWGGRVYTFDILRKFRDTFLADFPNLAFTQADVLAGCHPLVSALVAEPRVFLYCDNGDKKKEVELYAPLLREGSLLGVHDYNTEIPGAWVEPHVAALGYEKERHDLMEALRNEWYPEPMTRIWRRARVIAPVVAPVIAQPPKAAAPVAAQATASAAPVPRPAVRPAAAGAVAAPAKRPPARGQ